MAQLIIGFRVLRRQGLYGLMAVLGLALGLAVAIVALIYTWQETHYDSHIPNADRIHLIDATITQPGRSTTVVAQVPGGLSAALDGAVPGLLDSARVRRQWSSLNLNDRLGFSQQIIAVDPNWLDMIDLPIIVGDRGLIQTDVTAVLISERMAIRLFGGSEALEETFLLDETVLTVAGVFKNFPAASHMEADVIINIRAAPVTDRRDDIDSDWRGFSVFNYLLLEDGADREAVTRSVADILYKSFQIDGRLTGGIRVEDILAISLNPLSELHLNDRTYPWGVKPPADKLKLAVLASIAVLIVIIACVNHVNMSTVRSMERAREVAMRKILGAGRTQLVFQFLIEAAILASIALIMALVVVELAAGYAGDLLQTQLDLAILTQPRFLVWLGGLIVFVILAAGLYPAFSVSAVSPGRALASNARGGRGNNRLRLVLVIFQFSVSITLAIGAAVIWSQLRYARAIDLGFDANEVVILHGVGRDPEETVRLTRSLDQAIAGRPGVEVVSAANTTPAWDYVPEVSVRLRAETPEAAQTMGRISVDLDFFQALGIRPAAGRLFSDSYGADRAQWDLGARPDTILPVVVNERAVFSLGFDSIDQALGQQIQFTVSVQDDRQAEIVGVVPDVHFKSLKSAIQPMLYYPDPAIFSVMMIRIDPNQREIAMRSIEEGWSAVLPEQALSHDYLAATLAEQYDREAQELKAVSVLAGLGILIAIFGQYGLAAYSAQSRRREISIRKVLGARVRDILQLFVWQFSKPVFLAMVVAWPIAFFAMTAWLENFVYRVAPNPLWFVLAGIFALTVALLTVAGHAVKAARAAPVDALRYE